MHARSRAGGGHKQSARPWPQPTRRPGAPDITSRYATPIRAPRQREAVREKRACCVMRCYVQSAASVASTYPRPAHDQRAVGRCVTALNGLARIARKQPTRTTVGERSSSCSRYHCRSPARGLRRQRKARDGRVRARRRTKPRCVESPRSERRRGGCGISLASAVTERRSQTTDISADLRRHRLLKRPGALVRLRPGSHPFAASARLCSLRGCVAAWISLSLTIDT